MNLDELDTEYNRLAEVIESNLSAPISNLWQLCFHWWRTFKKINDQIDEAKDLKERDAIVASFATFQKKLSKDVDSLFVDLGIDPDDVKSLDDHFESYPRHMREMILIMRRQRALFISNVKAIKAEKRGKGTKVSQKLARKKRGWIKS